MTPWWVPLVSAITGAVLSQFGALAWKIRDERQLNRAVRRRSKLLLEAASTAISIAVADERRPFQIADVTLESLLSSVFSKETLVSLTPAQADKAEQAALLALQLHTLISKRSDQSADNSKVVTLANTVAASLSEAAAVL